MAKRRGSKKFSSKMKACGRRWRAGKHGKSRTWRSFLKKCLKK